MIVVKCIVEFIMLVNKWKWIILFCVDVHKTTNNRCGCARICTL